MVLINRNITESLDGVAKPMIKLTHLDSQQRKASRVLTPSSVPTAEETTKPIRTHAHSGDTASIGNGT